MTKENFTHALLEATKEAQDDTTLTILVGLGAYGSQVAHFFKTAKSQPKIFYLLKARPQQRKGIFLKTRLETVSIWLPKPRKTPQATALLWGYLLKTKQAQIFWPCKKIFAAEAKKGRHISSVNLCLVGNLSEVEGKILSLQFSPFINYLSHILGQKLLKIAFLLLPEPTANDFTTASYSIAIPKHGYDICFLLSTLTSEGLVDEQQTAQVVSEFMLLLLQPQIRHEIKERFANLKLKVGTFTLSTLAYPAQQLREKQIKEVVKHIIEQTIVNADPGNFHFLAAEFSVEENISVNHWLSQLKQSTVSFNPTFSAVAGSYPDKNITAWPQRLTNYKIFLLNSTLVKAKQKLEQTAQSLVLGWQDLLKQKLDELMQLPFGFKKAEDFLAGLDEILAACKEKVTNELKKPPQIEKIAARLELRLKEKILNFPYLEALFLRLAVFFFLVVLGTKQLLAETEHLPPDFINPRFLPPAKITPYLAGLSFVTVGWLSYKLFEFRLIKTKDAFLSLLEQYFHEEIDYTAKLILIDLLSNKQGSFVHYVRQNQDKIKKLRLEYLKLYQTLENNPVILKESAVKKWLKPEANINYKLGNYHPVQEFELFLAAGGHKEWTKLNSRKLYQRWRSYCYQGLKFYDTLTVTEIFLALTIEQQMQLLAKLRKSAYFYLKTSSGWPNLTEILVVNADNFKEQAYQPKYLSVIPAAINKIAYLKLSYPLNISQLEGYSKHVLTS